MNVVKFAREQMILGATALLCVLGVVLCLFWAQWAEAQTAPGTILRNPSIATLCSAGDCTGSAPTETTDGRTLVNASGVKVRICAESGQTLLGTGVLDVYFYDEDDEEWAIVPSLEITVPASVAGVRCAVVLEDRATTVPFGRVAVIPNGVGVSGGENLFAKIYVTVKRAP